MSGSLSLKYNLDTGIIEINGIENVDDLLECAHEIIQLGARHGLQGNELDQAFPFMPSIEELFDMDLDELDELGGGEVEDLRSGMMEEDFEYEDLPGFSEEDCGGTVRELTSFQKYNAGKKGQGFDSDDNGELDLWQTNMLFAAKEYCHSQGIDWVDGRKEGTLIAFDNGQPRYFDQKTLSMGQYVDSVSSIRLSREYKEDLRKKNARPGPSFSRISAGCS